MMFLNEYEAQNAAHNFRDHPALGPATRTLLNLMDAANQNSDGWAYWPKPARSAKKLMELIQDSTRSLYRDGENPATVEQVKAALRPIKAFRTRSGISFEIVEPA